MLKVIAFSLVTLFAGNTLANDLQTILSCTTDKGVPYSILWSPTYGHVTLTHGEYVGSRNTNDMGWSKIITRQVEDTEIYLDNGPVHNIISITDDGTTKTIAFRQIIGDNPDNIVVMDSCEKNIVLDLPDAFLANMIYVDDE